MIKSIDITNFQSHEGTHLDLDPGINSIVGQSNRGKSAILRALYWARYNRPSGESFLSHWARDEKEKQIAACSVRIEKPEGYVERERAGDFNGYRVNDSKYSAIKTDVPEAVESFFNMDEVNIQRQLDAPFLVSASPGEVARFFNQMVHLDLIDKTLSAVDGKKREGKRDLKQSSERIDRLNADLKKFHGLEDIETKLRKVETINQKLEAARLQYLTEEENLADYDKANETVNECNMILQLDPLLSAWKECSDEYTETAAKMDKIVLDHTHYKQVKRTIKQAEKYEKIEETVAKYDKIDGKIEELKKERLFLQDKITQYNASQSLIFDYEKEISDLKSQLPDLCPTCGQKLPEDV